MNKHSNLALCKRCRQWKLKADFTRYESGRLRGYCPSCIRTPRQAQDERWVEVRKNRKALAGIGLRQCTKCRKVKKPPAFSRSSRTCKICVAQGVRRRHAEMTAEERRRAARKSWAAMMSNPETKLRYALRGRLSAAMHRALKTKPYSSSRVMEFVGCTPARLRAHIESLFGPGMEWGNHGLHGWHIDHIIPLAAFDLTSEDDMSIAWHYSNLQPLWAIDNLRKHANMP